MIYVKDVFLEELVDVKGVNGERKLPIPECFFISLETFTNPLLPLLNTLSFLMMYTVQTCEFLS